MKEDPRLIELKDKLIDSTLEYLAVELSDKSINAARAVLKDLSAKDAIEGLTSAQAEAIKESLGDAPFKFGT